MRLSLWEGSRGIRAHTGGLGLGQEIQAEALSGNGCRVESRESLLQQLPLLLSAHVLSGRLERSSTAANAHQYHSITKIDGPHHQ